MWARATLHLPLSSPTAFGRPWNLPREEDSMGRRAQPLPCGEVVGRARTNLTLHSFLESSFWIQLKAVRGCPEVGGGRARAPQTLTHTTSTSLNSNERKELLVGVRWGRAPPPPPSQPIRSSPHTAHGSNLRLSSLTLIGTTSLALTF